MILLNPPINLIYTTCINAFLKFDLFDCVGRRSGRRFALVVCDKCKYFVLWKAADVVPLIVIFALSMCYDMTILQKV